MCRAAFAATSSPLPVNHFASTVLTAAGASPVGQGYADPNNVICEGCEENQAIEYCKDCAMAFCATCKKIHLKPKAIAHHQFILLDEAMTPGGAVPRVTRCEKHPHLEINTYCHTDKQAICAECAIDSHVGHQVERLANVVQGFREEIANLVSKVFFFLSVCFFFLISS